MADVKKIWVNGQLLDIHDEVARKLAKEAAANPDYFKFNIDDNGHLILSYDGEDAFFEINDEGHLVHYLDADKSDFVDLGPVVGGSSGGGTGTAGKDGKSATINEVTVSAVDSISSSCEVEKTPTSSVNEYNLNFKLGIKQFVSLISDSIEAEVEKRVKAYVDEEIKKLNGGSGGGTTDPDNPDNPPTTNTAYCITGMEVNTNNDLVYTYENDSTVEHQTYMSDMYIDTDGNLVYVESDDTATDDKQRVTEVYLTDDKKIAVKIENGTE